VALAEGGGAIKRWDLLGKLSVTELIPWRGLWDHDPFFFLSFAFWPEVKGYLACLLHMVTHWSVLSRACATAPTPTNAPKLITSKTLTEGGKPFKSDTFCSFLRWEILQAHDSGVLWQFHSESLLRTLLFASSGVEEKDASLEVRAPVSRCSYDCWYGQGRLQWERGWLRGPSCVFLQSA
jgi:hypothetical protein